MSPTHFYKSHMSQASRKRNRRVGGGPKAHAYTVYTVCGYKTRTAHAQALARDLSNAEYVPIVWETFADGTDNIFLGREQAKTQDGQLVPATERVEKKLSGTTCVFLADFANATTTMAQFHALIALCETGIQALTIVLPYFPVGTMERVMEEGNVATAHTLSHMLSHLPLTVSRVRVMVYDLHTLQNRFYASRHTHFDLNTAIPLLKQHVTLVPKQQKHRPNALTSHHYDHYDCIVFPDDGANKRYGNMFPNVRIIICDKKRIGDKRVVIVKEDSVPNMHASTHFLIVDDLTQSGGTLIECARCIAEQHSTPKHIAFTAFVTHGVFNGGNLNSFIQKRNSTWTPHTVHPLSKHVLQAVHHMQLMMTDSCPATVDSIHQLPQQEQKRFVVLSLLPLIACDLEYKPLNAKHSKCKKKRKIQTKIKVKP